MLIKNFKNNVDLYFSSNFKTNAETTVFYLLPSIHIYLDKLDEDMEICIVFAWLFWTFIVSKYLE